MTDETLVAIGEDYPELRESVRKICTRYPENVKRVCPASIKVK